VLPCVAVCCSVLQCVAACCSASQCVAACCSVLQSVLQCDAVCCSVCCSVLQWRNLFFILHCSVLQSVLQCVLQCVYLRCVLQCDYFTVQHTATCHTRTIGIARDSSDCNTLLQHDAATRCCNTLQYTAIHCNTQYMRLWYGKGFDNTLQQTANSTAHLQHSAWDTLNYNTAKHCNTLQHTATHCITL